MRDKEKQIEEMAKDIYATGVAIDGTDIAYGVHDNDDHFHRMAIKLYEKGYRKQSDTVREFVQKLDKDWIEVTTKEYGTFYAVSEERIQELAEKYGVE